MVGTIAFVINFLVRGLLALFLSEQVIPSFPGKNVVSLAYAFHLYRYVILV